MSMKWAGLLTATSVLVVIVTLGMDSLWLDEAFTINVSTTNSAAELWTGAADPRHPPLYYVIERWSMGVVGTSEMAARAPSALAFAVTIALTALLALRLNLGMPTASLASALTALSPLQLWYAQEARMYALVTTMGVLFATGLVSPRWSGALLSAAGLSAGLSLDFTTVPFGAVVVGCWLVYWRHFDRSASAVGRLAWALVVSAVAAAPALVQLWKLLPKLDQVTLFVKLAALLGIDRIPAGLFLVGLVALLLVVFASAEAFYRLIKAAPYRRLMALAIPSAYMLLTIVVALPRGYLIKPVVAVGWPFVTLLTAWILSVDCRTTLIRPVVSVCAIAAILTIATPRADWRSAVQHLNAISPEGEMVVWLDPWYNSLPYNYYRPLVSPASPQRSVTDVSEALAPDQRLCIVAERFGNDPPTSDSEQWLDSHMRFIGGEHLARLEVRCYARDLAP